MEKVKVLEIISNGYTDGTTAVKFEQYKQTWVSRIDELTEEEEIALYKYNHN